MIIWTGWGFLSAVFLIAGILLGQEYLGESSGDGIGLVIAAIVNFAVARFVNNPAKDRVLVDEVSGEKIALKKRSTLFWIPMEWMSALMIVLAVVNFFNLMD